MQEIRAEMERLKEWQALLQDEVGAFKEKLDSLEAAMAASQPAGPSVVTSPDPCAAQELAHESPPSLPKTPSSSLEALIAARSARESAIPSIKSSPVQQPGIERALPPGAISVPPVVPDIPRKLPSEPPPLPPNPPPQLRTPIVEPSPAAPGVPAINPEVAVPTTPTPEAVESPDPQTQWEMNQEAGEPAAPADETSAKPSFELRLGTYWLVRIGIVMILTGLVYLGSYAYKNIVGHLGAAGKVALLYTFGGLFLGAGAWLQRKNEKEAVKNYGQVIFAGGLAAVYFTTYAAHYFENLRVIASGTLDGALLLGWAGFMVWIADRRKSEVFAFFGIGLAYYSSFITQVGTFTLYSNLVLTIASVFFLVRNRWAMLSVGSQLATYAGFAFWRFHHTNGWLWEWDAAQIWTGTWFLTGYWIVFTAAVFLSRAGSLVRGARVAFLTLNNGAFFTLVVLSMLHLSQGRFWIFCLGYGSTLVGLAALARRFLIDDTPVRTSYLIQGLLLITVGFISYFAGLNLALVLAAESLVLVLLASQIENRVLKAGAQIVAGLAVCWLLTDLTPFARAGLWAGSAVGAVMILNAFIGRSREQDNAPAITWPTLFYTVLGLAVWSVTTWDNTQPEWRGLVFAAETAAFLVASRFLRNPVLGYGTYPVAALAVGWHLTALTLDKPHVLAAGAAIGGLMLFNAVWARVRHPEGDAGSARFEQIYFSALAQLIWLATTWNAPGDWRAVIFAGESVSFLLASRLLQLAALEIGAYLAGIAAVGLGTWGMNAMDTAGFWRGAIIGALMLLNGFEQRLRRADTIKKRVQLQEGFFTTLALVMWAITTWQNTTPPWRGLVLGIESVLFLICGDLAKNQSLRHGARVFGSIAVAFAAFAMALQFPSLSYAARIGLNQSITLGMLMLINARWERRTAPDCTNQFHPPTVLFIGLALSTWFAATVTFSDPALVSLFLSIEAAIFTIAFYTLRMREIALFGQVFLTVGQLDCLGCLALGRPQLGAWQMVTVIGLTVALVHWWQRQRALECTNPTRLFWQGLHSLAAAGILFFWLRPRFTPEAWMAVSSGLAIAVTSYGILTRAWFLAGYGQFLLWASAGEFFWQIYGQPSHPHGYLALAPIITAYLFTAVCSKAVDREESVSNTIRQPLQSVCLAYRCAAGLMTIAWIFEYIAPADRFWVLTLVGLCFFAWSGWRRQQEPLIIGLVFQAIGFALFWMDFATPGVIYWPNLLAIFAVLAQQQFARRHPAAFRLHDHVQTAMILLGGCSLWLYASRLVTIKAGGFAFYLTATWAVVAMLIFFAGFVTRERMHRWMGLAVLGCALGRVGLVDVWRLETVYRILSFMALGAVLLVLGFIYNRYQEKIRELL